ncbi:phosphatase PAP2/dual specificity phosphatase family protein [Chryseobacterium sp. C39-AII1]|uniref:phosphatase PAP2/dual specificity phosphatase family protein n=1 Tax=Chryseobacterium sp. C39-AII1 TaxID=3080332 RepID=UPI00320825A5
MDDEITCPITFFIIKYHHVQKSKMDEKRLKISQKINSLILCSFVFMMVYNYSAWHISKLENVPSFVFNLEKYIPFIPWTIIPYMTSGLFFCLVFFFCKTKEEIAILTKRMLFVTVIAGICFLLFPLKFSLNKPEINSSVLGIPFQFLKIFDSPFNQAPSLHIAYAFIFWSVFRNLKRERIFLMIWLILLGISTLTTYQHHLIDVLAGGILTHISFIIFPYRKNDFQYRNFQVANYYFLFSWIFLTITLLFNQFVAKFDSTFLWITLWIKLWITFSIALIGYQYQKNNIHFLKDKNGNISILKKIFYAPYLLIYWIFWRFLRKNKKPIEIISNIYISSKPNKQDLIDFNVNKNTFVYDLSAEIEETQQLKEETNYRSAPFLDIGSFDIDETRKLLTEITNNYHNLPKDGKILIHCTMGFTRSSVIGILVMKNILSLSLEEAVTNMKTKNKNAIIHSYVLDFLKKI